METLVPGRSYSDPVAAGLDRHAQTWPIIAMVLLGSALSLIIAAGSLDRPLILLAVTASLTLAVIAAWLRYVTWPAIFLGACGLTAGLGVGVRWLMIDGASPSAVAGLIALASGVAVVVASIARMSQRRPAWARALIILSVTLGVAVFVWTFSPAIVATDVPPIDRGESSPIDLGLSAEVVRFQTTDGVEIAAWYIPATDGKTVISEAWFRGNRGRVSSPTPQSLLATVSESSLPTPEVMDPVPVRPWISAGTATGTSAPPSTTSRRGPRSISRRWRWSECRWAGRRPSAQLALITALRL